MIFTIDSPPAATHVIKRVLQNFLLLIQIFRTPSLSYRKLLVGQLGFWLRKQSIGDVIQFNFFLILEVILRSEGLNKEKILQEYLESERFRYALDNFPFYKFEVFEQILELILQRKTHNFVFILKDNLHKVHKSLLDLANQQSCLRIAHPIMFALNLIFQQLQLLELIFQ